MLKLQNGFSLTLALRKMYNILKPKQGFQTFGFFNRLTDSILNFLKQLLALFIKNKGVKNAEQLSGTLDPFLAKGILPPKVQSLINEANQIEKLIPVSDVIIEDSYKYITPINTESGNFYTSFCHKLSFEKFHLVFLTPQRAYKFVEKYLSKYISLNENIVLIVSAAVDLEWLEKNRRNNLIIFNLEDYFSVTNYGVKLSTISKIIQNFNITSVHILNSKLAFDLYYQYGKSIINKAPLSVGIEEVGKNELANVALKNFFKIQQLVTVAVVENRGVANNLSQTYIDSKDCFITIDLLD